MDELLKIIILWIFFAIILTIFEIIMFYEGISKCKAKGYGLLLGISLLIFLGIIGFGIIFVLPSRYAKHANPSNNKKIVQPPETIKPAVKSMRALCPECKNPVRSNICERCGATNGYSFIKKDTDMKI